MALGRKKVPHPWLRSMVLPGWYDLNNCILDNMQRVHDTVAYTMENCCWHKQLGGVNSHEGTDPPDVAHSKTLLSFHLNASS